MCVSSTSSENVSLRLISLTCLLIMIVDSVVLSQTINQYHVYESRAHYQVFVTCYKPQLLMRIVFTCYAILAAGVCFLLTLGLSCLSAEGEALERLASGLFTFCYLAFGPLLLLFCGAGLYSLPGLLYECEAGANGRANNADVAIVLGCTLFSGLVTFFFSLYRAVEAAQTALRDERSVFYRLYFRHLLKRRQQRAEQSRHSEAERQALIRELGRDNGDSEEYGSIREEDDDNGRD